ncbi:MAG TPA: nitrogen regulation protein NR(I) [Rhodanobacteraceae bacterium]|nr:nitrogen regulation protein NR(I) [Rhodanobacteraceae bacterium]
MNQVWVVDDDRAVRFVLATALRDAGETVSEFARAEDVQRALRDGLPGLLLCDVRLPGTDGLSLLREVKAAHPALPVIVMSAYTDVATTAAAYREGAADYLAKPFDLDQALAAVRRALSETLSPDSALRGETPRYALLGESAPMREVFRLIGRVAASDLNVLITGETGTGKELVARALHDESARRTRPFVALNTAAIPAELLESELFGHEAGSFTGAQRRATGRFEQAEGGTLFLDEIGDMPLALQTRLLRVLAGGEFYRVGGRELIRADVRVLAATHQDLDAKVARGEFRADLRHRLDVLRIHLPALRDRRADIPLLAKQFLATATRELKLPEKHFTQAALRALARQEFPGNVRQLENLCRRLAVIAPGNSIRGEDLEDSAARHGAASPGASAPWEAGLRAWADTELARGAADLHAQARERFDRVLLDAALAAYGGRRQNAAKALGLGRNTLTRKLGSSRKSRDPGPGTRDSEG